MSSMATPDSRVRSELIALLSGRARPRTASTISRGNSAEEPLERAMSLNMEVVIVSQVSSDSVKAKSSCMDASSRCRSAGVGH